METTRLSYVIVEPAWLQIADREENSPIKKALRNESLEPVPLSTLKDSRRADAKCVDASMTSFTHMIFEQSIWCGDRGDRLRLPITLRDQSGTLKVTLWSSEFHNIIDANCDELGLLYAACEHGDNQKNAFLAALNQNADVMRRWILRSKEWKMSDGTISLQWNVAKVNEPPNPASGVFDL